MAAGWRPTVGTPGRGSSTPRCGCSGTAATRPCRWWRPESGVDKRTVRYHFGSKRELFVAARAEAFRRFVVEARRRVFSEDTARGRLRGWVDAYRTLHAYDTDVLRFLGFAVAEGITEPDNQVSLV